MKKDFLKLLDYTGEELSELIDSAIELKRKQKAGIPTPLLSGKKLAMIFEKPSTRTRVSFEVGMVELGGYPLFISGTDSQLGRGEPIADTARVLSRYVDGIMIRSFGQEKVEELAKWATVPVINGLTTEAHPCQVMADLMTIKEHKGTLKGLKAAYIGDGNNMANSLIVGMLKVGMNVSVACPQGYDPHSKVLEFAANYPGFNLTREPADAAKDAGVVITDVWTSMGSESETQKRAEAFKGYIIDEELMAVAAKDAMVQHCLPAHRGEEISAQVLEAHADEIFDEAENRLHAQKAIMAMLMG